MIPKVIHYCWFGGKALPSSAEKCIKSWKKYLPEFEIRRWDESNFDINTIPYTKVAYEAGKYAFVSDYARFWILHKYGGLYFDTDVEVIAPLDDIILRGAYMGREEAGPNPGLGMAAEAGHHFLSQMLEYYSTLKFSMGGERILNIVDHTKTVLSANGYNDENSCQHCAGVTIYPKDYFCPIDYETRELRITENTRTIHHYAESWLPTSTRIKNAIGRVLGRRVLNLLVRIKKTIKRNA